MSDDCKRGHEGHECIAGVSKLEVLPNGDIIPCPAFKGAARVLPEFVLGNVRTTTLEEAIKCSTRIPYLRSFRRWNAWKVAWRRHEEKCDRCWNDDCVEGLRLLLGVELRREVLVTHLKRIRAKLKEE